MLLKRTFELEDILGLKASWQIAQKKWLAIIMEEDRDTWHTIANDNTSTIYLPIFCFGGAHIKNSIVQPIFYLKVIVCLQEMWRWQCFKIHTIKSYF